MVKKESEGINEIKIRNPYKGLNFYEEKDKELFHGREVEKGNLFKLVKHNILTVVIGKSGIGKTSLINAGLFPEIRRIDFFPIKLRLNYSPSAPDLMIQSKNIIQKEIKGQEIKNKERSDNIDNIGKEETLWEYFHRFPHFGSKESKIVTPVLVFDQFEELFTIGESKLGRDEFINELFYLIENQVPDSVEKEILNNKKDFPYLGAKLNVRVVICLREDYLYHLNPIKSQIPSIDRVVFRVTQLNGKQAREIIGMPDGILDQIRKMEDKKERETIIQKAKEMEENIMNTFYPEEFNKETKIEDEKLEIEPFILSLLCYQFFNKLLTTKKNQSTEFVSNTDKKQILKDFYEEVMKEFTNEVKEFIEMKLLTESGFRTLYQLNTNSPFEKSVSNKLIDKKIIRREPIKKQIYIEIIHDSLVPIIVEKRNKRLEEKRRRDEIKEKLKERNEKIKKRDEELKKLKERNKKIIYRIISIVTILSLSLAAIAIYQWVNAKKHLERAKINNLASEAMLILPTDNVKALRIAEAAYRRCLPNPPPRVMQVLSAAAASTYERPFPIANFQHNAG